MFRQLIKLTAKQQIKSENRKDTDRECGPNECLLFEARKPRATNNNCSTKNVQKVSSQVNYRTFFSCPPTPEYIR